MRAPHALVVAHVGAAAAVFALLLPASALAQSTSSSTDSDSSSSSSSTIIYVIAGVVALLVLLGGGFFWKRRQRKSKRDIEFGDQQRPEALIVQDIGHPAGNGYDLHTSPAVAANNNNKRVKQPTRPPPSQPPASRPLPGRVNDPQSSSNDSSSYIHSSNSSNNNSTSGRSSSRAADSARTREVLTLVLEDLQTDAAVAKRRIAYSALYFTRVLSKGAFGEVWLAQLENRQVAVKRILSEKRNDEKEIVCFGAEIKLMASFAHPKIVEFVGVAWSATSDLCAVTEYMAKGDLFGFLKRRNGQLNWMDHKIYLAEDVADALVYLHTLAPKVIHRDLKSKNILLDDAFRAKLSDFGISRERSLEETMTAGVGTIYWTAPEVLMGKKYTEKADIYSFGIVLSELDTHMVPYHDVRDDGRKLQAMKIVQKVIREHMRPTFSATIPPVVLALAQRCINADPDVRPDAMELLRIIQTIQNEL